MQTSYDKIERIRLLVAQAHNRNVPEGEYLISPTDDVQLVWFSYILGGFKAMCITTAPDQKYYEVTYNKEKQETYVDVYTKLENLAVTDGAWIQTPYDPSKG
jgi:hypothetical protein